MSKDVRNVFRRYVVATVGLMFVAMGVALSIIPNLGTAPLSCPAYVLNLRWPAISVGTFTLIVNTTLILVQLLLWRSKFRASYLMQIVASAIFGYMIDASLWAFSWLHPSTFVARLVVCLLAAVITAIGVSIEVKADSWMLSAEMTVAAFSQVFHKRFGPVKVVMDSLMVVVSIVMCAVFFGNPLGAGEWTGLGDFLLAKMPGIVIGPGTLLLAILPGALMRFSDPWVKRLRDWEAGGRKR